MVIKYYNFSHNHHYSQCVTVKYMLFVYVSTELDYNDVDGINILGMFQ